MSQPKPPRSTPSPSSDSKRSLKELAGHFDDEKTFLTLAKQAWREEHYQNVPKRGRPSVEDQCFDAIIDGFDELDMACDYAPRFYEMRMGVDDDISIPSNHERLPLGRLVQMIRDRIPGIKLSTARKYARIWERDAEPFSLAPKARMDLYKQMKKKYTSLYKGPKPKSRR